MTGAPLAAGPADDTLHSETPPDPVDWDLAERVGRRVAGRELLAESYHRRSLETDFAEATERSLELVAEFTALEPRVGQVRGRVLDRGEWVGINVASFRRLLHPLTRRLGAHLARSPFSGVGRRAAGLEAGVIVGWFAQRVLGQYDLMATDPAAESDEGPGSVYYVGPNVLALERRHGFRPRDFRLWIAIHEVTHLVQFTAVPWLRGYFLDLVERSLDLVDPDPKRLSQALVELLRELRAGRNPLTDGTFVTLLASPEQREVLARVQALMALLEGHGNFVMDRLGERHVEGQARMSRVLRERRRLQGLAGQVQRLLGLELKLRQYAVGEQFLAEVERSAGRETIAVLWEGPEMLPTLEELRAPSTWIERAAGGSRPSA